MSTLLSTPGQVTMGGMVGSNALVNILKPVNIVNLGNTLRCGVGKRPRDQRGTLSVVSKRTPDHQDVACFH